MDTDRSSSASSNDLFRDTPPRLEGSPHREGKSIPGTWPGVFNDNLI